MLPAQVTDNLHGTMFTDNPKVIGKGEETFRRTKKEFHNWNSSHSVTSDSRSNAVLSSFAKSVFLLHVALCLPHFWSRLT
jgi:uncharacterized protein (UPF0548 family)